MAPAVSALGATAPSGRIVKSRGQVAPFLPPTPMLPPTQATASTAPSHDANAELMAAIAKLGLAPESCGDLYKALYNDQAANALHEPIMISLPSEDEQDPDLDEYVPSPRASGSKRHALPDALPPPAAKRRSTTKNHHSTLAAPFQNTPVCDIVDSSDDSDEITLSMASLMKKTKASRSKAAPAVASLTPAPAPIPALAPTPVPASPAAMPSASTSKAPMAAADETPAKGAAEPKKTRGPYKKKKDADAVLPTPMDPAELNHVILYLMGLTVKIPPVLQDHATRDAYIAFVTVGIQASNVKTDKARLATAAIPILRGADEDTKVHHMAAGLPRIFPDDELLNCKMLIVSTLFPPKHLSPFGGKLESYKPKSAFFHQFIDGTPLEMGIIDNSEPERLNRRSTVVQGKQPVARKG